MVVALSWTSGFGGFGHHTRWVWSWSRQTFGDLHGAQRRSASSSTSGCDNGGFDGYFMGISWKNSNIHMYIIIHIERDTSSSIWWDINGNFKWIFHGIWISNGIYWIDMTMKWEESDVNPMWPSHNGWAQLPWPLGPVFVADDSPKSAQQPSNPKQPWEGAWWS